MFIRRKRKKIFILILMVTLLAFLYEGVNAKQNNKIKQTIENFDNIEDWDSAKSSGTKLNLTIEKGIEGNCISLDYNLDEKNTFVLISKKVSLKLPENYQFVFYIKGVSSDSNLEFKVIDENENTYWKKWNNYQFPKNWEKVVLNKADITYAWGSNPNVKLSEIKKIELAISSDTGGEGKIFIDELSLLSVPALPEGKEILKNFSFEKGAESWGKFGNAKDIEPHDWHPYEGKWSYGIGNDNGPKKAYGEIYQEIRMPGTIKEKDLFIFKMWLKSEDNYTGKASLKLVFLASDNKLLKSYQSKSLSGKFTWTKLLVSGEAPKGTKKVVIKCTSRDMTSGSGCSFVWFDNANIDCPIITASSVLKNDLAPKNIMKKGKWHSKYFDNQSLMIDFREIKKFTGLSIDWDNDYAKNYEILISDNGQKWDSIYKAIKNNEGLDKIYLDETCAQFIKIKCAKSSTGKGFGIKEIEMMDIDELVTLKKYYKIIAEQSPGYYPGWMLEQQAYWTVVGVEDDENEAVIGEDGSIEPHKRGFSIAPFLYLDNKPIARSDVKITQSLEKGYLPIPTVKWNYDDIEMDIKLFTYGKSGKSIAYACYKIENKRDEKVSGKLYLALRPFQVYPPWQGGTDSFTPINKIEYSNNVIKINNEFKIFPLIKPEAFGSIVGSKYFEFPFKTPSPPELGGDITSFIKNGMLPKEKSIEDTKGFGSCALEYDFELKSNEIKEFFVAMPLHKKNPDLNANISEKKIKEKLDNMLKENIAFWESKIDRVEIDIPEQDLINVMKANVGFNLVTKDGPALQPGSRTYDKAWWRDGSIQASSLLKMGLVEEARDFIDWMVTFQYDTGEVPPIIDNKADDPLWEEKPPHNLKEYDSQGQLVWAILEYYYFTKDRKFLMSKWENVYKSLKFMEQLRKQRLTDEYNVDDLDMRRFYGILPQSRSHEGYWFAHSYWDDWWALKGWKDAKKIAEILKEKKSVINWIDTEYNAFLIDLTNSIKATAKFKNVNYISGCAEKGDFDPTSVAVAINYSGELENVEKYLQPYLHNTFETYWNEILKPRLKPNASFHFVPYEARNAPVFIYMGQKDRALALLRFLVNCCRPYKWYQLAEVVNYEPENPCYLGDMPHAWVGSEFINGVRALFVYEKDDLLILGHGIDEKWLERKEGISVKNLPTYFGEISYDVIKEGNLLKIKVSGDANPHEGFVFKSPFLKKKIKSIMINGKKWKKSTNQEVLFNELPVEITVNY